jgi:MOSC domain-containing protein YiiM
MRDSVIRAIYLRPGKGKPTVSTEAAQAIAGNGLMGDHQTSKGVGGGDPGREVTLIELKAIEAAMRESGVTLEASETRRNLLTQGIELNDLVGREFLVGEVRLRGIRLCHPCQHLERLTRAGVKRSLEGRGGLRAEVLCDGLIRVGDPIQVLEAVTPRLLMESGS